MIIPTLPKIDQDLFLEVCTHGSRRDPEDPHSNADRLAFLGEKLIEFAMARHWYEKHADYSAHALEEKLQQSLSDQVLQDCLDEYDLERRLGGEATVTHCRLFLSTYAGALCTEGGLPAVQRWISKLIDPDSTVEIDTPEDSPAQGTSRLPEPVERPPEPTQEAPPVPPYSPPVGDVDPFSFVSLAVFNQHATQQRHKITWESSATGEAHQLDWTLLCLVDDVERGRGTATSQKVAKEKAAREAWRNMGWSVPTPATVQPLSPQLAPSTPTGVPLPVTQAPPYSPAAEYDDDGHFSFVTLSMFNQVAVQKRCVVDFPAESTGPAHQPSYIVRCVVNGQVRGTGAGRNKREAKERAARRAWGSLGWSSILSG
ncbi:hypothetical protein AX17_000346 [Amanita inopinata Kibby_2008]|nr:hypothetical protein AX17_000346 [Amanita inopinata Kibby_2008]